MYKYFCVLFKLFLFLVKVWWSWDYSSLHHHMLRVRVCCESHPAFLCSCPMGKEEDDYEDQQLASGGGGLGRVALKRPSWRPLLLFGPLEKMQRLGQLGPSVGQWPHRGSSSDGSFTALYSYCSMEPLAHPKMEIRVQKAYCDPRLGNIDIPCPLAVSVSSCHPQPHYVPSAWLASFSSIEIRFLLCCFLHCHLQQPHSPILFRLSTKKKYSRKNICFICRFSLFVLRDA